MVALFRIVELVSGSINIDGVDISKIGLDDVRNAISILRMLHCVRRICHNFRNISILTRVPSLRNPAI